MPLLPLLLAVSAAVSGIEARAGVPGASTPGAAAERPDHPAGEARRRDQRRARHGTGLPNLALPTAGGLQVWGDVLWDAGWRIQRHALTGHHRLLDPRGVRRAWGGYAACRAVHERARIACRLVPPRRLVIALAGIGRTRHALAPLRAALGPGDALALLAYPSTRADLASHAAGLRQLLADLPGIDRVAFVTHSLGALVVRHALAAPAARHGWPRIDGVVMLFPPNRGAALADRWHRWPHYRLVLGPAGQELTSAAASTIPRASDPVVVIAGGRGDGRGRNRWLAGDDDGTVRVEETRLPEAREHLVVDAGHTFGMRDARVLAAVRAALASFRVP
jgi:hypothetical protein